MTCAYGCLTVATQVIHSESGLSHANRAADAGESGPEQPVLSAAEVYRLPGPIEPRHQH